MATDIAPATMDATSLPTTHLTPSRKRNHQGDIVDHSSPSVLAEQQSSPLSAYQSPSASQDPSDQPSPLTDLGATPCVSPEKEDDMAPKKPKLTFAEKQIDKQIKQAEKDEKERLKAEVKAKKDGEKAKREEDKARKDEEKKRKDEEREAARRVKEEKQREKDAEKQAKEQAKESEKQKKEAEVLKKERAQMRLGAFFGKPAATSAPPAVSDCEDVSRGTTTPRRNSITSIDLEPPLVETKPSPIKPTLLDEKPFIMPFFVKEYMEMAPCNRFRPNTAFLSSELPLNQDGIPEKLDVRFHKRQRRARPVRPLSKIMGEMNGLASTPIDLTSPEESLVNIRYKYLFHREDVRPPYQGTFTRAISPRKVRKLAVKPSYRGLPDTDYDYDSEAEWAEPEEGDEEVLDDDEKSVDEDGDEEMDDFLDDEGEQVKRQLLVGDSMEPKSSGLCWEGDSKPTGSDFSHYRMDVLHDSTRLPIDPYSTVHWSNIGKKSPMKKEERSPQPVVMQPPRMPLMAMSPNGGNLLAPPVFQTHIPIAGQSENIPMVKAKASTSGKPIKTIPLDLLPTFRAAISGSTLTKVGLLEVLKTQFPKCTKDAIKHTVEGIAERRGAKGDEKKWVLLDG